MRGESRRWQLLGSALLSGAGSRPERFDGVPAAVEDVLLGLENAVVDDAAAPRATTLDEPSGPARPGRQPGLRAGRAPAPRPEPSP